MKSESRPVANFNAIELRGYGDITLEQGEEESLVIETDAEMLPHILSEVHGERLVLSIHQSWLDWILRPHPPIHYTIHVRQIKEVSISGAGELDAGPLHTDSMRLDTSGSARMRLARLEAQALDAHTSGSARIEVAGQVDHQKISISGAGKWEAAELSSQEAQITISGSGEADLAVERSLNVQISGAGQVRYRGRPQVSQRISGSGSVEQSG